MFVKEIGRELVGFTLKSPNAVVLTALTQMPQVTCEMVLFHVGLEFVLGLECQGGVAVFAVRKPAYERIHIAMNKKHVSS